MNTYIPKAISGAVATSGDDRKGLGYGVTQQRFHKPRKLADTFPFVQEDQIEKEDDFEIDEESQASVSSKILNFQKNDPGAAKSADRLYYVGAATKLRACFDRPDEVLEEISGVGKGMVPIPRLYKKGFTGPAVGGYSTSPVSFSTGAAKKTGTKRGWSTIPPESKIEAEMEYNLDDDPDEFFNLEDLANIQRPSLGECFLFYKSYLTNAT